MRGYRSYNHYSYTQNNTSKQYQNKDQITIQVRRQSITSKTKQKIVKMEER